LLYLSAPSRKRGLIVARGNFSTSLYASLSRTQVDFGGPSTFGLEIARTDHAFDADEKYGSAAKSAGAKKDTASTITRSSFALGSMIDRGCFNYRWPFNEYYLDLHDKIDVEKHKQLHKQARESNGEGLSKPVDGYNGNEDRHVGICQMFSCAVGDMFYQLLRIEEGCRIDTTMNCHRHFPPKSQVVLTMLGPVWFRWLVDEDDTDVRHPYIILTIPKYNTN
jgi:hypothetical protein